MTRSTRSTYGRVPNGGRFQFLHDSSVFVKIDNRAIGERSGTTGDMPVTILADIAPPYLSILNRRRRRVEQTVIELLADRRFEPTGTGFLWGSLPPEDRRYLDDALSLATNAPFGPTDGAFAIIIYPNPTWHSANNQVEFAPRPVRLRQYPGAPSAYHDLMTQVPLPEQEESLWIASTIDPQYPLLRDDITVDVAIIGAGIAGLSAAYLLKSAGLTVAVLEQDAIGAHVTGHTTGKVTSQHGLCYAKLTERLGAEAARAYGAANQAAIEQIEQIIVREGLDCDWRRADNYVFTEQLEQVPRFRAEADAARRLGLPASFETQLDLPFPVAGAVGFAGQAQFHARKYLLGLARAINQGGSHVYERTQALTVLDGRRGRVFTTAGSVKAQDIIIATNVPSPAGAHTYYGLYEYPLKTYAVAAIISGPVAPTGMYITPDAPARSIFPITTDGKSRLLIVGESHFPGLGRARPRHQHLADYAAARFGARTITHRWSTWDYLSNDQVPLIGRLYPWSRHVYTATGFMKWGLTTGAVAGLILRDAILGEPNPWANVFKTDRLAPVRSLPQALGRLRATLGS